MVTAQIVRRGSPTRLFALGADVPVVPELSALDPEVFALVAPSVPVQADLAASNARWAVAEDTTYAVDGIDGHLQLSAYELSSGKRRWRVECGAGRLASVGRVLVLVEGDDLVAYR